jgi:hypothetical protein
MPAGQADINAKAKYGQTLLQFAAESGGDDDAAAEQR